MKNKIIIKVKIKVKKQKKFKRFTLVLFFRSERKPEEYITFPPRDFQPKYSAVQWSSTGLGLVWLESRLGPSVYFVVTCVMMGVPRVVFWNLDPPSALFWESGPPHGYHVLWSNQINRIFAKAQNGCRHDGTPGSFFLLKTLTPGGYPVGSIVVCHCRLPIFEVVCLGHLHTQHPSASVVCIRLLIRLSIRLTVINLRLQVVLLRLPTSDVVCLPIVCQFVYLVYLQNLNLKKKTHTHPGGGKAFFFF